MSTTNLNLAYATSAKTLAALPGQTLDYAAMGIGNSMMNLFESVLTDYYPIDITSDYTVLDFESYLFNLVFTSTTLVSTAIITLESGLNISHLITNETNKTMFVTTDSGASHISIGIGEWKYIYFYEGEMVEISNGGYADYYYSNYFKAGGATNSEDIVIFPLSSGGILTKNSITAYANTASAALSEYDIYLDAGLIGDINFSAGVNLGVTSMPVPVEIAPGQALRIVTPASADASIADIGINIEVRT